MKGELVALVVAAEVVIAGMDVGGGGALSMTKGWSTVVGGGGGNVGLLNRVGISGVTDIVQHTLGCVNDNIFGCLLVNLPCM